jgi:hypothetical protein
MKIEDMDGLKELQVIYAEGRVGVTVVGVVK